MPQKRIRLVVGLGNPGNTYKRTRHNVGFMVVDQIAEDFSMRKIFLSPLSNKNLIPFSDGDLLMVLRLSWQNPWPL